jgi:pimeloyl-ACP methyl ester carboxylesterase
MGGQETGTATGVRAVSERSGAVSAAKRANQLLTADGARLHVEEHGSGPLTVILLHGWTLDRRLWRRQVEQLPARLGHDIRMLAVDLRGHGWSPGCSRQGATLEQLADDLHAVLRERAPRGPVVLVGHSLGGMTILEYAHRHGAEFAARVVGVALISTSAEGHAHTTYGLPPWLGRLMRRLEIAGAAALARGGPWKPHRALMPVLRPAVRWLGFGDRAELDALRLTLAMIGCASLRSIGGFRPAISRMNRVPALRALSSVPVVVMVGSRDRLTPLKCAETMAVALPNATSLVVDGCGHLLPLECPDAVTDAIADVCRAAVRRAEHR